MACTELGVSHRKTRRVLRRLVTALLCGLVGVSCASRFESGSKITSLRVLGVQKDKPYARQGDTVHLTMLLDDGGVSGDGGKRNEDIQILWLSGCEDPPGDAYAQCIADAVKRSGSLTDFLGAFTISEGLAIDVTLSSDTSERRGIISRRPLPSNPAAPPYGTAYVFFAVCAGGTIKPAVDNSGGLPVGCFKGGKKLGPDSFVIGYTELFAYEKITNKNPIVTGFEVDGQCVEPDCIGEGCIALEREELGMSLGGKPGTDAGSGASSGGSDAGTPTRDGGATGADAASDASVSAREAGAPASDAGSSKPGVHDSGTSNPSSTEGGAPGMRSDTGPPPRLTCGGTDPTDYRTFDVCTTGDKDTCEKHTVKLVVDPVSAEHDAAQEAVQGGQILEQMWINYYSDAGKLEHDVKLLNDATTGWNENHSADLRSPLDIGPFHVWAVAHDNRGGSQWARVTLTTRVPANGFP